MAVSLDFIVTNSYRVKSHFDSNIGISCQESVRAQIKPYRDFCPPTAFVASVTSFTFLSTVCVWQGNFGKMTVGVTSIVVRSPSSVSIIALITGAPQTMTYADCIVEHVEVFHGKTVEFCRNLKSP